MPSFAYWMAVAFVRRRTAPLDAWYCGLELSVPTRPSWEEMLTMEPPRARRMAGITARVPRTTPVELTAMIRSQSARVVSSIRLPPPMPALLTRTSSFPYKRSASATAPAQSDSLVTSRRTNVASPPTARISSTVALPSASRTSPSTTFAPSFVNRRPASAPIPRAPPLISATFPSSLMCPSRSEWLSSLHSDDDLLREAHVLAQGIVVGIQQRRFVFERFEERSTRNLRLARHLAVLARQRRQQSSQPLGLPLLGEVLPQELLWRCVQAAVVTDLVDVNVGQQGARLRRVPGFLQRVAPVLDLCIAREQKLPAAHLEQEDQARVVHLIVEGAHDLQELVAPHAVEPLAEPARFDRDRAITPGPRDAVRQHVCALECSRTGEQVPELIRIPAALLPDILGLLQARRPEHVYLHAGKQRIEPRWGAVMSPHRPRSPRGTHGEEILHRRLVPDVVFPDERELLAQGRTHPRGRARRDRDYVTSDVVHGLQPRREALRAAAGIAGGLRGVGRRVGIFGPRLQDHLRLQLFDDLAGLAGCGLRGKPADVVSVAMRRDHRGQAPPAIPLDLTRDERHVLRRLEAPAPDGRELGRAEVDQHRTPVVGVVHESDEEAIPEANLVRADLDRGRLPRHRYQPSAGKRRASMARSRWMTDSRAPHMRAPPRRASSCPDSQR